MNPIELISVIGFPLLMAVGGFAAWRMNRHVDEREAEKPQWRDTSLDDWRKQRDAETEVERTTRVQQGPALQAGGGEEQPETKRHQRIGG